MTEGADVCTKPEPAPPDTSPAAVREVDGRWKGGSSPNPGGKTRRERNLLREVRELAGQHAPAAIRKLRRIMDNRRAPYVAQIAAASAILDRAVGKPSVPPSATLDDGSPTPIYTTEDLTVLDRARRVAFLLAKGLQMQQGLTTHLPAIEHSPSTSDEQEEPSD